MKIGIWLGYDIKESAGGAFSYTDRLIQLIDNHSFPEGVEVCFVSLLGGGEFKKEVFPLLNLPKPLCRCLKSHSTLYRYAIALSKRFFRKNGIKRILDSSGIKVMYYLHQGVCLDSNFPFIATNWDIGHRSTHAFPELMWDGKSFEERESFYRSVLPKSLMVFCESKAGEEELAQYTNIGFHKLRILPMFGGSVTHQHISEEDERDYLHEYNLEKGEFFFYPAQFWAHKNHKNLIKSFSEIHNSYPDVKLVLSGSDKGNKSYIEQIITELGLNDYVVFLGFVPIEVLYCMYKNATALVMASHFGPTNMPPIEAMEIGCPVACSDLGGHHEILGDSAAYFDSFSVPSMVGAMKRVYEQNSFYKSAIEKQRERTAYSEKNAMETLDRLLLEISEIRSNWL